MGIQIRYMGAKHRLSPIVSVLMVELKIGPCLDLFSGMSSVAGALAKSGRQAWGNDIQRYSTLVTTLLLTAKGRPQTDFGNRILKHFEANQAKLLRRFRTEIASESEALRT